MELNNFEYGATKKVEGKLKTLRNLLIALYIGSSVVVFAILCSIPAPMWFVLWVVAGLPILVPLTWRYTQVDYKYIIESGKLTLTRKYGNFKPTALTSLRIKEAEYIGPTKEAKESGRIAEFSPELTYDAVPSVSSPDSFVILYKDNDGKRCAMYIEVAQASLKALHYYNSSVPMVSTEK